MKKLLVGIFTAWILSITALPTHAADMKIKVDGVTISSDVKPEFKNNRTMVPLRVISENLGARVNWSDTEIVLKKSNVNVVLKLNSNTAMKNGKKVPLDAKPYLKNNRVMVPLRFIAEMFGSNVGYSNFVVTVENKPLVIDGVKVKTLQHELYMTMGGIVNRINGNAYNEAIYNLFVENKGKKVEEPAVYSSHVGHLAPGDYYKAGQYDFLDQEGDSIKRFDIYTKVRSMDDVDQVREVLIYEANVNQWYMFNDKAHREILELIDTASNNGFLTEISNNVP
ncbi:copper amine oxidase N-terminal domain-containing protein [Paenibacillus faecis]|uniref:Copper amine oxidase N-terminal domain-containing protein n=1 Tax=Paenibacillus faecis TaxID=862114 RepID=A0A5D0CN00_9BACL|nr:copper amine oxidase N-terminal domain-containing protein [Paenibacillus faecis]TYA11251.1 copper amine oxidase N-terminal domain-containing protein [Paenibacillus faecis]